MPEKQWRKEDEEEEEEEEERQLRSFLNFKQTQKHIVLKIVFLNANTHLFKKFYFDISESPTYSE